MFRKLVDILIEKNLFISAAESCTGGMFASCIVDIPDASRVLGASFVTYSDEAKAEAVGVSPATIASFGVVSEQTAAEMATGAAKHGKASVGVGITGCAGPSGGTENIPVGTVCFGFYYNGKVFTDTVYFGNIGRNNVRKNAVMHAAERLIDIISELPPEVVA